MQEAAVQARLMLCLFRCLYNENGKKRDANLPLNLDRGTRLP